MYPLDVAGRRVSAEGGRHVDQAAGGGRHLRRGGGGVRGGPRAG